MYYFILTPSFKIFYFYLEIMSKKNIFKNNFNHSYPVNQVMGLLNMLWKVVLDNILNSVHWISQEHCPRKYWNLI